MDQQTIKTFKEEVEFQGKLYITTGKQSFINGNKHGKCEQYWPNGVQYLSCNYQNNQLEGKFEERFPDGTIMTKCTYSNGKKEGLYMSWYQNNKKFRKIWYKADKRHGLYESWYNDDKRDSKTEYLNGIKHGIYQKYENDIVIKRHRYINGIPVSRNIITPLIMNPVKFKQDSHTNIHQIANIQQLSDNVSQSNTIEISMINKQNIPDICTTLSQFSINNMLDSMVIYEESPRIDIDLNSIMLQQNNRIWRNGVQHSLQQLRSSVNPLYEQQSNNQQIYVQQLEQFRNSKDSTFEMWQTEPNILQESSNNASIRQSIHLLRQSVDLMHKSDQGSDLQIIDSIQPLQEDIMKSSYRSIRSLSNDSIRLPNPSITISRPQQAMQQRNRGKSQQGRKQLIYLPKRGTIQLKNLDNHLNIDKELQNMNIHKVKGKFNYLANRFCADTIQQFLNFQGPNFQFYKSDAFHLFSDIGLCQFTKSVLLNIQDNKVLFKILVDICIGIARVIQIRVKDALNHSLIDNGHMKAIDIQIKTIIEINDQCQNTIQNKQLFGNMNVVIQYAYQTIESVNQLIINN